MTGFRFLTSNYPYDFALEVQRGKVPGVAADHKFGRNAEIDSGVTADIWDGGFTVASGGNSLIWVAPTTARTHAIASSDDEDGGAGTDTGALTLRVYGLDSAFALQQEDITMNGTTNVNTASTYTMIHRMVVLTAGSTGSNVGDITATAATDNTVTARIRPTKNQTMMAIYQVPTAKTLYMTTWFFSLEKAAGATAQADITLLAKPDGEVYQTKAISSLASTGGSAVQEVFHSILKFDAKTTVKIQCTSGTNNNEVSGSFCYYLVDD